MKNNSLTIYLGGKMGGLDFEEMNGWRKRLKLSLETYAESCNRNIEVINPVDYFNFEEVKHQNEREVMQFDLNKVRNSDLLIVNANGLNTSIGTAIEIYEANKLNIPVILYDEHNEYKNVHPWLQCCTTRVEPTMKNICEYIKEFYM